MSGGVQRSVWRQLGRGLAITGTFFAVGPLIGLVAFAAAVAGYGLFSPKRGDYAAAAAAILIYGFFFAHFMGAIPAIVSGVTVAAVAAFRRAIVPGWIGAAAGGLASALALSPERFDRPSAELAGLVAWIIVAVGMLSGAVCTRLTRRWHQ